MNAISTTTATYTPQSPTLRVFLLGPMRIERDGARMNLSRRKVESLLAYLLLHPEQHARDHLATLFWGDSSDAQARHSLRTALATVRQQIDQDLLHTDRNHVQLNAAFPLWVDLRHLLSLEDQIDQIGGELLQAHLDLWQGELLMGLYEEWIPLEREHYRTRLLKLFLQITHSLRARSEYAQAIKVAQRVLMIDPANEPAHQHLMFCYVASDNRSAALRQYELCERALEEELDASPMAETTALYHWIKQFDQEESSTTAKITNLPIPLTSFVGRTRETAAVKRLLSASPAHKHQEESVPNSTVRLLTLIGAGGSGKTRLAIQTATDLIDGYAHGVWWVELAALTDGGLVAHAVAKTLGTREVRGQTLTDTVANFVGDKQMLLVLDNCEHLIEPCAQLAAALLGRCPNLQILATSRVPLYVAGEALWQVPTFGVPDPTKLEMVDLLLQFESIRLFVTRAAAVLPTFALTPENAHVVTEICHRLDGIPLAIELAAARVKVLAVEQIAAYLASALGARFALLTQGSRSVLPRHQTLRAAIDWSYDLLDDSARMLFRRVALFRGGFTLETLEQLVTLDALLPHLTVLDLLTELVDQSLILVEQHGGQNRYRMLETLREYALEQYPSSDEMIRLQRQHAELFLRLADEAEPELVRAQQQAWLNRLDIEHANLRAALETFIANEEGEKALRLAAALSRFWEYRGYVTEGRNWLRSVLANRGTATLEVQGKALNAAGRLAFRQGDLEQVRLVHEEALFLFQQSESEIGIADSLCYLAVVDMEQGEYSVAQQRLDQALEIYRMLQYELGIANVLSRIGTLAWDQDRFADAVEGHRGSLRIYQKFNMPLSIAFESLGVGDAERMLGNLETARQNYEECMRAARSVGHRGLEAAALKSLGLLALRQEEYEQARHYGIEALHIFRELGDRVHTGFTLSHLGDVAHKCGEIHQALTYFGECLQLMYEVGYKWPTFYALEDIVELLTEVGQHPEVAVRFLGAADKLREATGLAVAPNFLPKYEQMSATLRHQLGDERFTTLWQEGQETPLAQIVSEATQLTLA